MFLIRTAFWLSLLILILPTDKHQQRIVYSNAETTVKDLGKFCTRNPNVCEASRDIAYKFGEKAQFGARMIMDFIQEQAASGSLSTSSESIDRGQSVVRKNSQNTLTSEDLRPAWSVSSSGSGV